MRLLSEPKISLNSNLRAPLAALVDIIVDEPVSVDIVINCGDRSRTLHYPIKDALQRQLPIIGLYPDGQHFVSLAFCDSVGHRCNAPMQLSLQAPSLPTDPHDFPHFRVIKNDASRREPGWTLLSVHRYPIGRYQDWTKAQREFTYGWGMILALDRDGDVVWYYQSDAFIEGIDRLSNGNLLFHRWDFCTHEIDWLGNPIQKWYAARRPQGPISDGIAVDCAGLHHQPKEMPNGNLLMFTAAALREKKFPSQETTAPHEPTETLIVGDGIAEVDRSSGAIIWHWSTFDHLSLSRRGYGAIDPYWSLRGFPGALDWTHGNGATYDESTDSVILSLKNQDAILSVDRGSGGIRWIIGEPTDWGELSEKILAPVNLARWPYHGHNPRLTKENTIVYFDNGTWGARPPNLSVRPEHNFSRAVEYRVNERQGTVEEVWSSHWYDGDSAWHAPDMSDAHRLPVTGNMLVIWAHCLSHQSGQTYDSYELGKTFFNSLPNPSRLREYGRKNNDIVFELHMYDPHEILQWGMYGGLVTYAPCHKPYD